MQNERQIITDIPPYQSKFLFEFVMIPNNIVLAGVSNQNSLFISFLLPELSNLGKLVVYAQGVLIVLIDTDVVTMFAKVRQKMREAHQDQVSWTHS